MDSCCIKNEVVWPHCVFRVKSKEQGDVLLDQAETLQHYGCIPKETQFRALVVEELLIDKGSGGGFVESLPDLPKEGPILYFLVGESATRIPAFSFRGKSFSPLPGGFPFCRHYYKLGHLLLEKRPYLTVTCGDTLLEDRDLVPATTNIDQGIWALTCPAPLEAAQQVGSFVIRDNRIVKCLQKASLEELQLYEDQEHKVYIDTGIFCLDRATIEYIQGQRYHYPLHFYAELIPSLLDRGINPYFLGSMRFVHIGTSDSYIRQYLQEERELSSKCPMIRHPGPALENHYPGWTKKIVNDMLNHYFRSDKICDADMLPWIMSCQSIGPYHSFGLMLEQLYRHEKHWEDYP